MHKIFVVSVALLFAFPYGAIASRTVILGSGKSVGILSVGPLIFKGGASKALFVQYRTLVPLDDMATLTKEVNKVWSRFVVDAEKEKYEAAIISAESSDSDENTGWFGITTHHRKSFHFIFEKKDGAWNMTKPTSSPSNK